MESSFKPEISLVIPTYERAPFLVEALKDLLNQNFENFEIIIVDQSKEPCPEAQEIASKQPEKIKYLRPPKRGLPYARNYGWRRTQTDKVIFIDDDVRIPPQFVKAHLDALSPNEVSVVAGAIDELKKQEDPNPVFVGKFFKWRAEPARGFNSDKPCEVDHVPGGNFSVKKSVLESVQGFDEDLSVETALYEELDFCLTVKQRLKSKMIFAPGARLKHLAAESGGCRATDIYRYIWSLSRNRTIIIKRHLSWIYKPTAYLWWLKLVTAYVVAERKPGLYLSALKGWWSGLCHPNRSVRPEETL